jgi:hypothetical protein
LVGTIRGVPSELSDEKQFLIMIRKAIKNPKAFDFINE